MILPKKKLLRAAIPIVLCAPMILPLLAVKGKASDAMFMPLMGVSAGSKYTAPPASGYKGKLIKSTNTLGGTTITFSSVDIGTVHSQRIGVFAWNMLEGGGQTSEIIVGGTALDYTTSGAVFQSHASANTSCIMCYLALDSSYGTTTTITHTPNSEAEPGFQIVYWIIYPSSPAFLSASSTENITSAGVATSAFTTQPGGLITLGGFTNDTSGLTGAITTGTGTLVKNDFDVSVRSIAAFTVTCDGSNVAVTITRDVAGTFWEGALGYSWARAY